MKRDKHKTNSKCIKNNTVNEKESYYENLTNQSVNSKRFFYTTRNIQVHFFSSQIFRTFWTFRLPLIHIKMRHKQRLDQLQNILIKIYSYI